MSAPQSSGGYPPPQTYPPPYGQQQQYPSQGQSASYPQAYQAQQQYPSYQQPAAAAPAAPAPAKGGGLIKIMAILTLVGLVLAGVGFLVVGLGIEGIVHCETPGNCNGQQSASADTAALNDSGLGFVIAGVGLLISGIGFGMIFLALPKKFDELAPKQ